jgi:hypothetical protein
MSYLQKTPLTCGLQVTQVTAFFYNARAYRNQRFVLALLADRRAPLPSKTIKDDSHEPPLAVGVWACAAAAM